MDDKVFNELVNNIRQVIDQYEKDAEYLKIYYEIGKLIINNQNKFSSKEELLTKLSQELDEGYGKANLSDMRRLYDIYKNYPEQFELAQKIGWSHNRILLRDINIGLREQILRYAIDNKLSAKGIENELGKRKIAKKEKTIQEYGFSINIEGIKIKNFKSIVDLKIEKPNPFTVFVGSNACGKSNIFSAIDLLFYSYYNSPQKAFNEYGADNLFNFDFKEKNIEIVLNTGLKKQPTFLNNIHKKVISIEKLEDPYNKKIIKNYTYLHIKEGNKEKSKSPILEKDGRNYINILTSVFDDIQAKKAFIAVLQEVVSDISEVAIEKNINGTDELFIKDKNYENEKIPESLISDGTKNIIIILTAILQSKEPQLIIIEEPENGLHPLILEPFIGFIRSICKRRGHFIWFTTHSPLIVRHLKRQELIIVNKINGQTKVKKANNKEYDNLFSDDDLPLDDAWLTQLFEEKEGNNG